MERHELPSSLTAALVESQRQGFLGDRPIAEVIDHAWQFVEALRPVQGSVVDLGAGGGVPGLVIAVARPDLAMTLVDRRTKRTDFLERMSRRLDLAARVMVAPVDVQELSDSVGASFDAAVARGFGPPDVTLAAACSLVAPGGRVIVSEPPSGDRWEPQLLSRLGVSRRAGGPPAVAVFEVGSG